MYHWKIEGINNWKLLHSIGSLTKWKIQLRNGTIIHSYIEGLGQTENGLYYLKIFLRPGIYLKDIIYARCGILKIVDKRKTEPNYVAPKLIECKLGKQKK